jgi:hypothetical protein
MEITFLLLGLACFIAAEIFMAVRVWRQGFAKFSLTLVFPGYEYLLARRKAFYWPYYLITASGAAFFLAAAISSTFE